MFTSLFRRLTRGRRVTERRGFVPELTALEDRSLPSAGHSPLAAVLPPTAGAFASAHTGDSHALPFKVTGEGFAPVGLVVIPGGTGPHTATGTATHLGRYTGNEGLFQLLSLDPATGTGTFRGSFVFVAANGDRLVMNYGAETPGTFTMMPTGDGRVIVRFVAEFTPVPEESTGRFAKVTGGSFTMVATTEPFSPVPNEQGFTAPFSYTWEGQGFLQFSKGKP